MYYAVNCRRFRLATTSGPGGAGPTGCSIPPIQIISPLLSVMPLPPLPPSLISLMEDVPPMLTERRRYTAQGPPLDRRSGGHDLAIIAPWSSQVLSYSLDGTTLTHQQTEP